MSAQLYEFEGYLEKETEKAYLINFGDRKPLWIPKSQVKDEERDKRGNIVVHIPEWLAKEKGLL